MNNYYIYYPCPGTSGAIFYSNVGPSWTTNGNYIQFNSNVPDKITIGACYHFALVQVANLPSNYVNIDWNTAVATIFSSCEECVESNQNDPCLNCPPGFTLVGNVCERYTYIPATYTGNTLPISKGATQYAYGKFGLRLYPDITSYSANFPLVGALYTPPSTLYEVRDNTSTVITPLIAGLQSNLWGSDSISPCPTLCTQGRLNLTGIWPTPPGGITFNAWSGCSVIPGNDSPPYNTPVCFQYCVDINTTKQYLIGIAGDNEVSITIDGVLVVNLTNSTIPSSTTESTATFNYWHVFPITLSSGSHTIEVCGVNKYNPSPVSPTPATFGAEIYDIDLATFQSNFTDPIVSNTDCGNLAGDIDPYVLFSTSNLINSVIADPSSPGEWLCPEGTILNECNGAPSCQIITTTPTLPCGYEFVPCCGGNSIFYQISEGIPLTENGTYLFSGTNECYTVFAYTGPAISLPFQIISINDLTEINDKCNDLICQLPCSPCICTRLRYSAGSGTPTPVDYYDCNGVQQLYTVPIDGSWGEKVCMKAFSLYDGYEAESFGDCVLDSNQEYICPPCYILEDCDGIKDPIYTLDPIIQQYIDQNKVIKIDGLDTCWIPSISEEDCDCAISVSVQFSYDNCTSCKTNKGYKLTECFTGDVIYTTTDLSDYTTVTIEIDCPGCWTVEPVDIIPGAVQPVTVLTQYGTCTDCNATYYELTDCTGIKDPIYTSEDLSQLIGQVVQIRFCPDTCWTVAVAQEPINPGDVYVDQTFVDCPECFKALFTCTCQKITYVGEKVSSNIAYVDCTGNIVTETLISGQSIPKTCMLTLATPPGIAIEVTDFGACINGECPPLPLIGPLRSVKPGYNTPACSPEYYENVVCNYSEWMYKDVLKKRYGISSCCDEEILKWEIKKELLDLDILVNPDYTCAPDNPCGCPTATSCGCSSCNS